MTYVQIYSMADSWEIQILEDTPEGILVRNYTWNHNDSDYGAGGELTFAQVLEALGHKTYVEEVA